MTPEELWQQAEDNGYPSDFYGPDHLYTTHWPFFGWADRGDDILAESNYHVASEELLAVNAETDPDREDGLDDVMTGSTRHWAVGSLQQVWVRAKDDNGGWTPAWIKAAELITDYQSYPVLDESDYSEREWAEYERQMDEALGWVANDDLESILPDDMRRDLKYNVARMYSEDRWDGPNVDYDLVQDMYDEELERALTEYGGEMWAADVQAERDTYDTDIIELAGT
jgi:hypothetical protein